VQRVARIALAIIEVLILSALILAARCANYQDVFVGGDVYFTDADCYARMTRVQMCEQHPGLIVRHHDFENFPAGVTPHTTAPLDYLILVLSILLRPFTGRAIDLAGALISPLLALLGGWFLWWWSRRMKFRYHWPMLILYAISSILVHGTELGRPDHQSLLMLLITVAVCAEWTLRSQAGDTPATTVYRWSVVNGIAWGSAIWVSAYEPLLIFMLVIVMSLLQGRGLLFAKHRRGGWIWFAAIIALALVIERRIPSLSIFQPGAIFRNWSSTIGELARVSPTSSIWFRWAGWLLVAAPFLAWVALRSGVLFDGATGSVRQAQTRCCALPIFALVLLVATYCLTIWQARWAYFFMSIFVIVLPSLLEPIKSRVAVWGALALSIFPILRDWDERIWPNESELARRVEHRHESVDLHELAITIRSLEMRPFLAPWWLSPSIAYWSGQPGVGGSSHESLPGVADSARFLLSADWQKAREILENHKVAWVFACDADRVAENSAAILSAPMPEHPLCQFIERTSAQAPWYLLFAGQNGSGKLFRVVNSR